MDGVRVAVLGLCVSAQTEENGFSPASHLLHAAEHGEESLLRATEGLSGRFVVLYDVGDGPHLVQDATSMRSVFYSLNGTVASHAGLVARASGTSTGPSPMPFQYGYPGNRTPFPGVYVLTANTILDLDRSEVRRAWPMQRPPGLELEGAVDRVLELTATALRNAARGRDRVLLSLTAGLDSRATMAVALHAGVPFSTFSLGNSERTIVDRDIASYLARIAAVPHTEIPVEPAEQPSVEVPGDLGRALAMSHYAPHHPQSVGPLLEHIRDPRSLVLTGNLLEIGRTFYHRAKRLGLTRPLTPTAMCDLHHFAFSAERKAAVDRWDPARFRSTSIEAFADFMRTTRFPGPHIDALDPFDQFYWEHRMSTWHGPMLNERDFYGESFIPFNARGVFEAMLGLPEPERRSGSVLYRLIERTIPDLLDLPVNPPDPSSTP